MPPCSSLHALIYHYIQQGSLPLEHWAPCIWTSQIFWSACKLQNDKPMEIGSSCLNNQGVHEPFHTNCLDHLDFVTSVFPFLLGHLAWTFNFLKFWALVLQSHPFGWTLSAWPLVCCDECQQGDFPLQRWEGALMANCWA